jgi:hypothetical protein
MKVINKNVKTAAVGTLFGGSLLFTAGMGIAGAEPVSIDVPDGLVSVTVGGTPILENVPAEVAANASAAICGPTAGDASALAQQVDTEGVEQTVCTGLPGGDLVVTQNVSVESTSPVVPETEAGTSESAPAEAPADEAESSTEGDLNGAGAAEAPAESEDSAG